MVLKIDNDIELHVTQQIFAKELIETIDNNREHLTPFMPWVGYMQTEENAIQYIQLCENLQAENKEISFVILNQKKLVGRIGIHFINQENKCGAIGYWLSADATGKGIITKSCKKLLEYGFQNLNLVRIELKAATKNYKSQAIAERLHFTKEGVLRQAEFVNGKYLDIIVYAMLQEEWMQNQ
jgi:ribosomal-protein-serine acetyltransferase